MKSMFNNPAMVKEQLNLPAVVCYSFVGETSPRYHAMLEEIVGRVAGDANVRNRSYRASSNGTYTAYRFEIYHDDFATVEALYREVTALEGTRFVI